MRARWCYVVQVGWQHPGRSGTHSLYKTHRHFPLLLRGKKTGALLNKAIMSCFLLLFHPVGALHVEFSQPVNLKTVEANNPEVRDGGRYTPKDCKALQKVAIIIPFRKRDEHLKYWLYYLHPILQRQQLDYGVYVINQDGEATFNRAKLLNVGFTEALKEYDYDCFVFSDVDLIPMDDRNTYKCYSQPRHLSVSMDKFGFRLPYNQYFGGVSALSKEQFQKINGFPNNYWGWGGEDDDIYNREAPFWRPLARKCLASSVLLASLDLSASG
ncbi:Beta-1,4-galactosyltransferase 1 [Varanus komodoensis]|nr:Beta-1,4-galactosyltransferase 1 [Varanus komodoensis]